MLEKDTKYAVEQYLQILQNQGKLVFLRLNAGDFIVARGGKFERRIKGCPKGTADLLVIRKENWDGVVSECGVYFFELKSDKGKQSPEQKEFQVAVEAQCTEYHIIRSVEQVQEIFGEK